MSSPSPRQLTVFISSTLIDLRAHREKVEELLNRVEASFRSMKFFGSKEGEPLDQCLKKLRECNYYLGIIGFRYGEVHPDFGLSYTELEYDEAKRLDIPRRIYIASSAVLIQAEHVETDEKRKKLETFKQKLKKENTVVTFSSPEDLTTKVVSDILFNISEKPGIVNFAKRRYLPAIRSTCSSISFLGLDIQTMKRHKDVKLESVYVQSHFATIGTSTENVVTSGKPSAGPVSPVSSPQPTESLSLRQMLSRATSVVVLGDPGSGKSTLAKYLVTALVDRAPDVASSLGVTLPIRVPLRAYGEFRQRSGGIGVTIRDFIEAFAKTELQLDSLPEGFFEFYLERKDCLLIFDGLDEIFNSHLREQVKNDIVAFVQVSFPGNHAIITSRKFGYEEASFPTPHFDHSEILPFDDDQISEYTGKWYRLEETDKHKRDAELSALQKAIENLPKELLRNPLLLSLIVILFRSGCTLPESKLEIYRSCIGTLTEKWDAAGKRLELPENYNRVRDKKNAFARIAYWMYQQQSLGTANRRLRYPEVLGELTRYLCEREFRGTETEAQQAAEDFLEYSAKRSIFVEDRFSHKTFHEYFAALYIYRNHCLGNTVEHLYQEIKPCLRSDSWAVVLELLFLMLDEQSGSLLDALLEKIIVEVKAVPISYDLLLAPLRALAQLHNIGRETVGQLIFNATEMCIHIPSTEAWKREPNKKEAPHQRVFSALEKLPPDFHASIVKNLRDAASRTQETSDLLPFVAFHYEFPTRLAVNLDELIPSWQEVRQELAGLHLSAFYSHVPFGSKASERICKFIECFGKDQLFKETDCIFRPAIYFIPIAEYILRSISSEEEIAKYDLAVSDLLSVAEEDYLLSNLVSVSIDGMEITRSPNTIIEHFSADWPDPRKYLVDWLILLRILASKSLHPALLKRCLTRLRSMMRKGSAIQKFYSGLLLKKLPANLSMELHKVGPNTQAALTEYARRLGAGGKPLTS